VSLIDLLFGFSTAITGIMTIYIFEGDNDDDAGIPLQDGWDNPFFSRFPSRRK